MNINKIKQLSAIEGCLGITLAERGLKLCEEAGELSAAILKRTSCPNASASAQDNVAEEAVDTMINCLDILFALGYEEDGIQALLDLKCKKWEDKMSGFKSH